MATMAAIDAELAGRERRPANPAALAVVASRGRWQPARHLALLDRRLLDLAAGRVKRLLVTMPPRHGKSELCSKYLPAWYAGTFPDRRIILCSYEHGFASDWGAKARDVLAEHGPTLFGVSVREDRNARDDWGLDRHEGGMVTAGVGGPITGKGANLLVLDDPVKNAEQAASEVYREKTFEWWRNVAVTRLEPEASALLVCTRWHEADLAGRLLAHAEDVEDAEPWSVLSLPALAEEGEPDPLGRKSGGALWPERWPASALLRRKEELGSIAWSALYQQRPTAPEGNYFRRHWFTVTDADRVPALAEVVRAWDLAATVEDGSNDPDWLAGVKIGRTEAKRYYVLNVIRERLSPEGVEQLIRRTAEADGKAVKVCVEQEGAASGKIVRSHFLRMLDGYDARFTGVPRASKYTRSGAFNAACERGDVVLVRGRWNETFIEELASFPNGKHDDQCDAAVGAYTALADDPAAWKRRDLETVFTGPRWSAPAKKTPRDLLMDQLTGGQN
jgi:predicted phage terminase large subunit-like protein